MIIEKKISLNPEFLNKNYEKHILEILKVTYEGKFTFEEGYIKQVQEIISCICLCNGRVNSYPIFLVKFKIDNFKPKVGDIYNVEISMMKDAYIICSDDDFMIMISKRMLNNQGYFYNSKGPYWENDNNILRQGEEINVKILYITYSNGKFKYIGSPIN